jgi:DNA-directed RNA polymerase subunit K
MQDKIRYTKYEKARMIGSRALQISMGAPFLLKLSEADLKELRYGPIEIATREFEEGVLPITVVRPKAKAK